MAPRVLCLGAGGHASVVVDLLQRLSDQGQVEIAGIVAPAGSSDILGIAVLGDDGDLPAIVSRTKATHFVVGVGSVRGDAALRVTLFERGLAAGLEPFAAVHPSAVVAQCAIIEPGAVVVGGTVVQARARIAANAIVNTGATVDHDSVIGAHAHIAPGVTCSGGVTVGERAHVGAGAVLIEGVTIGAGATVGAGAVVISDCAAGATVVGVPAKPIA